MEDRRLHFDTLIKGKVDAPIDHGLSSDWETMAKSLGKDMPIAEDQAFDRIIKNKVTALPAASLTKGWQAIADTLDKERIEQEKTFDSIVYKKLALFSNERLANWPLFLGQLEDWEHLRRRIVASRILEALAMVMLLLFSYQYTNQPEDYDDQRRERSAPMTDIGTGHVDQDDLTIELESQTQLNENHTTATANGIGNAILAEVYQSPKKIGGVEIRKDDAARMIASLPSLNYLILEPTRLGLDNSTWFNNHIDDETYAQSIQHSTTGRIENHFVVATESALNSFSLIPIALLAGHIDALPYDRHQEAVTVIPLSHINLLSSNRDGLSLAFSVSVDAHYIATPRDKEFNLSPFERFSRGYGGSVRINKKKGNFSIESGLAYHYVDYKPKELIIIESGSIAKGVFKQISHKRTEMHFLEIPVDIQYNFLTKQKYRLYTSMGASINMNIVAEYDIESTPIDISSGAPAPSGPANRNNTLTQRRDYSEGILEGGSILDNSYLTTNLGLGMDYALGRDANIFFQVLYHHRLGNQGIGPNEDRFHLTSFNTGLRLPLSKGF